VPDHGQRYRYELIYEFTDVYNRVQLDWIARSLLNSVSRRRVPLEGTSIFSRAFRMISGGSPTSSTSARGRSTPQARPDGVWATRNSSGAMDVQATSGHPRPGYVRHSRKIRKSPAASSSIWRGDVERAPVLEEMITSQLGGTMWRQAVEAPGSGITLAIR